MILGEPGHGKITGKQRRETQAVEIDFAQTWRDLPKPAKFGVPSALVLLAGWMLFPDLSSGRSYEGAAEVIGRAILDNDRAKVIAQATPATAQEADRFFDQIHDSLVKKVAGPVIKGTVTSSLLDGNPEKGGYLTVAVIFTVEETPTAVKLEFVQDQGQWRFDAVRSLEDSTRAAATPIRVAKKR